MLTLGIDLAAQPKFTAAAFVNWAETVEIEGPYTHLDDQRLLKLIARADRVGIDVPLGWPQAFISAVSAYAAGEPWPDAPVDGLFTHRATDRFVRQFGIVPLSVAADKIAIPAMRAARLLSNLAEPLDRSGSGKLVEVYPAASLRAWGFPHRQYKGREGWPPGSRRTG